MENLFRTFRLLLNNTTTDFIRYLHDQISWNSRLVAILGARGVGKTTSALCFADILARDYDKRVLVIDLDAQRNTGSQL